MTEVLPTMSPQNKSTIIPPSPSSLPQSQATPAQLDSSLNFFSTAKKAAESSVCTLAAIIDGSISLIKRTEEQQEFGDASARIFEPVALDGQFSQCLEDESILGGTNINDTTNFCTSEVNASIWTPLEGKVRENKFTANKSNIIIDEEESSSDRDGNAKDKEYNSLK